MHELAIVDALIEEVRKEVERAGAKGRVMRLDLTIGRLSGVNPDSFRFAFEMLSPGTVAEAARLAIVEPGAVCRCLACGTTTGIEQLVAQCPRCQSDEITIEGGQDLLLQSIELEEPEPGAD